jgi:hypothetical protein
MPMPALTGIISERIHYSVRHCEDKRHSDGYPMRHRISNPDDNMVGKQPRRRRRRGRLRAKRFCINLFWLPLHSQGSAMADYIKQSHELLQPQGHTYHL